MHNALFDLMVEVLDLVVDGCVLLFQCLSYMSFFFFVNFS